MVGRELDAVHVATSRAIEPPKLAELTGNRCTSRGPVAANQGRVRLTAPGRIA